MASYAPASAVQLVAMVLPSISVATLNKKKDRVFGYRLDEIPDRHEKVEAQRMKPGETILRVFDFLG